MVKIVIIGSCRHSPYDILAKPNPVSSDYHNEAGYQTACKTFYPAIENADEVWVYVPEGKIGEHTQRDLDHARKCGKQIFYVRKEMSFRCHRCGKYFHPTKNTDCPHCGYVNGVHICHQCKFNYSGPCHTNEGQCTPIFEGARK